MKSIPQERIGLQLNSRINKFFKDYSVGTLLNRSNFKKEAGYSCLLLLKYIFTLVFTRKNLFQFLQTDGKTTPHPQKDSVYRLLNSPNHNWRKLLLLLGTGIIKDKLNPLTAEKRERVLIIDDSLYSRNRSKKVELLARVKDHVSGKYIKGFRMLTLGWSDGNSFVPFLFSLLSSAKEKNRLMDINENIDKRTVGFKQRQQSIKNALEVTVDLIREALRAGIKADYVLFDSWFAFPTTITQVKSLGLDTICMVKAMPKIFYLYQGKKFNLKELYSQVKKRRGKAKILASVIVDIGSQKEGWNVPAKVVFVRDRNRSKQWLAILTTDIDLSDEEVVRIYSKRWDIEVFFKMSKSYLKLAKEFQGRSYDQLVGHTTIVFMRYIMLMLEAREQSDSKTLGNLFFLYCEELKDISFAEAILIFLDVLKEALKNELMLTDKVFRKIYKSFISQIPSAYLNLLGIQGCES